MTGRMSFLITMYLLLVFIPIASTDDTALFPADKSSLSSWFNQNVGSLSSRKSVLDLALVTAEGNPKVITVSSNGGFKTITDTINSISTGNTNRFIVKIGPGTYHEKITIGRDKPFITFYGDSTSMPTLVFDGTAADYGTVDSATLIVESDYFVGVNLNIVNSAPRPDGIRGNAQAVALRISGDKAAFYGCKFHGFQDTLLDDRGKHFFKDCYIEGTVDFIFGGGKSIYLNTEIHVIPGETMAIITAQARRTPTEDIGYSFVHCTITGTREIAYLGRSWMPYPKVVFSYSDLNNVVNPLGWNAYFGEYKNKGVGSDFSKRVSFAKKIDDAEAKSYISLGYVEASKWLLPPTVF